MTVPDPDQQPPVVSGHTWPQAAGQPPPAPPAKRKRWLLGAAVVAAVVVAVGIIGAVIDRSTLTSEEAADEAEQACVEDYVPGKLAPMADPETARFAAVKVSSASGAYVVTGRLTAERFGNDGFGGLPNRYRFECSLKLSGDQWVANYSSVSPI